MTATPSETHEAALSDEQVQEIIDGCEGVTPGPWKHHRWESRVIGFYGSVNARIVARAPEVPPKLTDWGKDATHIARLDPDTVRALATELLARRTQPSAGEVVQCCMCGKKGLSTVEGDGGPECQLDDGRWTCSADCYDRATPPDQSRVERLEAVEAEAKFLLERLNDIDWESGIEEAFRDYAGHVEPSVSRLRMLLGVAP